MLQEKEQVLQAFFDEKNYRATGSQINSHTTLQNVAQIFKETETASKLRAKNPSQTHKYLEVTQQSKKQNKGKRKDEKNRE